jgi:hypothetical protein
MPGRSRSIVSRRLTALVMIALLLAGCSTWRMQGQAPATVVSGSKKPLDVRVTLQDGRKLELYRAVVQGDSLVGIATDPKPKTSTWGVSGTPTPHPDEAVRIAVALSGIRAIELRATDGVKTALFITGVVFVSLAFYFATSFEAPGF